MRVDHPMCLECTAQLREELDARVRETKAECDTYRECLRDLGEEDVNDDDVDDDEWDDADDEAEGCDDRKAEE